MYRCDWCELSSNSIAELRTQTILGDNVCQYCVKEYNDIREYNLGTSSEQAKYLVITHHTFVDYDNDENLEQELDEVLSKLSEIDIAELNRINSRPKEFFDRALKYRQWILICPFHSLHNKTVKVSVEDGREYYHVDLERDYIDQNIVPSPGIGVCETPEELEEALCHYRSHYKLV